MGVDLDERLIAEVDRELSWTAQLLLSIQLLQPDCCSAAVCDFSFNWTASQLDCSSAAVCNFCFTWTACSVASAGLRLGFLL
ncbi:unnamed protein product [Ilex paraguariensis]|uniref:Uncharacterized protein n=1 Tax=Ilex paraguariensis TaxID=185542 RepID=A0ABC8S0B4_9AQUA